MRNVSWLFCFVLPFASGCAHDAGLTLSVDAPTTISEAGGNGVLGKARTAGANEAIAMQGQAALLSAPGKIPVYIVNVTDGKLGGDAPLKIRMKALEDWKPTQTDVFITRKMDELYIELFQVLQSARNQKAQDALARAQKITESYPKLASAYYVKAQVEVLTGNSAKAITSLDTALKLKPEFQDAIVLRNRLRQNREGL